jgi:hypothetical protein
MEAFCVYDDFLVGCSCVNAPPEEGAWLEAADGTRHPIHGSCSLGRTAANTIVLQSPKKYRADTRLFICKYRRTLTDRFPQQQGNFFDWLICILKRV